MHIRQNRKEWIMIMDTGRKGKRIEERKKRSNTHTHTSRRSIEIWHQRTHFSCFPAFSSRRVCMCVYASSLVMFAIKPKLSAVHIMARTYSHVVNFELWLWFFALLPSVDRFCTHDDGWRNFCCSALFFWLHFHQAPHTTYSQNSTYKIVIMFSCWYILPSSSLLFFKFKFK